MQNRFLQNRAPAEEAVDRSLFPDGFYAVVGIGIQGRCTGARGFEAFGRVMFGQSHDPQRGSEPLLRMTPTFDNPGDQGLGVETIFTGTGDPGGSPFQIFLVRFGHVLRQGRMLPFFVTPCMAGDPLVFEQHFYRRGR